MRNLLFSLAFMLVGGVLFANSYANDFNNDSKISLLDGSDDEGFRCCTAIVFYKGKPVKSFTECAPSLSNSAEPACEKAEQAAKDWICEVDPDNCENNQ